MEPEEDQMLYITFNQDCSCIAVGTERGYRIYNSLPFGDYYERIMEGGIGIIEMLYKSNILALVGGGKYPKYPQNKVILWDDHNGKMFTELFFTGYVNNVKMKKDYIMISCDKKIYIFNLSNFQQIDIIAADSVENKKGLFAITVDPKINLIAYPDQTIGYVRVKSYDNNHKVLINAHDTPLVCLILNNNGKIIATASKEGRHMRLFRTDTGKFIYEFLISSSFADVFCLCFDIETSFICCSMNNGLIQLFSLKKALEKETFETSEEANAIFIKDKYSNNNNALTNINGNPSPRLHEPLNNNSNAKPNNSEHKEIEDNIPVALPHQSIWTKLFSKSEAAWSVFHIPENKSIVSFVPSLRNKFIVLGAEGKYYLASFNINVNEMGYKEEEKSLNINLYE